MPYETKIEVLPDHIRAEVSGTRVPGETVALNRAYPISVFDSEKEAKDWLLS